MFELFVAFAVKEDLGDVYCNVCATDRKVHSRSVRKGKLRIIFSLQWVIEALMGDKVKNACYAKHEGIFWCQGK